MLVRQIPHRSLRLLPSARIATTSSTLLTRTFATTAEHKSSGGGAHDDHGGHDSHYDPPGGWLWGLRPGEQYEKEGWENLFIYGFMGSFVVAGVAYAFKPDTSIQTWALEEARRRLEAEGILEYKEK